MEVGAECRDAAEYHGGRFRSVRVGYWPRSGPSHLHLNIKEVVIY